MLISVSTNPLPLFGITHSLALYKSYPAAKALPLVGVFAYTESFFTSSGGDAESGGGGGGGGGAGLLSGAFGAAKEEEGMSVMGRLGKGDVGKDGGSCHGGGGVGIVHERSEVRDALTCLRGPLLNNPEPSPEP